MIETHRSIVGHSQCDGNRHMNVSAYVRLFSEAGQNLFAMHAAGDIAYRPANRHFRFHRELEEGARTLVLSVNIGAGDFAGQILHVMQDADRGFISSTCLDSGFGLMPEGLAQTAGGPPAKAKPRSIAPGRYAPADTGALLANRLAMVAHRNRVGLDECDSDGCMKDGDLVGRFFASASQLWAFAGISGKWFADNGYGGAAVEMKLTVHEPIRAGQDYAICSWVPRMTSRMLPLSNQMVSVPGDRPLASISASSIVMDRATRMAVDIPDEFRRKHAARFGKLQEMAAF
ncbi:MAG: thioesterase family protein [Nitratireductor sp.]|nr:thioesterase family protein [Nitratireductor sp.]